MPCRLEGLAAALHARAHGAPPLVAFDGAHFAPAGFGDDVGAYGLIPELARGLNLTLPRAAELFYTGTLFLALLSGLVGCLVALRTRWAKAFAALVLPALALACLRGGDVYVVPAALALGLTPWALVLARSVAAPRALHYSGWLLMGLLVGAAHFVRTHSGTPLLVLALALIIGLGSCSRARRALAVALIFTGLAAGCGGWKLLLAQRDAWLAAHEPARPTPSLQHPFWHSVYIGLGFLPNDQGLQYLDETAIAAVRALAPRARYLSAEYEAALRDEVARLAGADPGLILRTLAAKLGRVLLLLLETANIGLLAALWRPKDRPLELGFGAALLCAALPGLLVMPFAHYLFGFAALAAVYGVVSLDHAAAGDQRPNPRVDGSSSPCLGEIRR